MSHKWVLLIQGQQTLDVPATGATEGDTIDLRMLVAKQAAFDLAFTLSDASDRLLSRYQRVVRIVPDELLKRQEDAVTADPFSRGKKK